MTSLRDERIFIQEFQEWGIAKRDLKYLLLLFEI